MYSIVALMEYAAATCSDGAALYWCRQLLHALRTKNHALIKLCVQKLHELTGGSILMIASDLLSKEGGENVG